uniref:Uncharacterized protein n=2 Tax=Anguilla anguilla TaxID=7936 RepID=A0A0E9R123_ANGAN
MCLFHFSFLYKTCYFAEGQGDCNYKIVSSAYVQYIEMTACEKGLNPSTRLRAAFSFGRSRCGNSAVINHVRSDFPLKLKYS